MGAWLYVDQDGDVIPSSKLAWRDVVYQTVKLAGNLVESVADYLDGMRNLVASDANHHIEQREFLNEARAEIESFDSVEESNQE